jgi:hypothetical protein
MGDLRIPMLLGLSTSRREERHFEPFNPALSESRHDQTGQGARFPYQQCLVVVYDASKKT